MNYGLTNYGLTTYGLMNYGLTIASRSSLSLDQSASTKTLYVLPKFPRYNTLMSLEFIDNYCKTINEMCIQLINLHATIILVTIRVLFGAELVQSLKPALDSRNLLEIFLDILTLCASLYISNISTIIFDQI